MDVRVPSRRGGQLLATVALAAYVIAWHLDYESTETVLYASTLFKGTAPWYAIALSSALAMIPMIYLKARILRPSDVIIWIIYVCVYVPTCYIALYTLPHVPRSRIWLLLLTLAGGMWVMTSMRKIPLHLPPAPRVSERGFSIFVGGALVATSLLVLLLVGFRFDVSLSDPYSRRLEARSLLAGTFSGYLVAMFQRVLIPFAFIYGVVRRRYWLVLLAGLLTFPSFVINGTKTSLALPAFIIMLRFLMTRRFWPFPAALLALAGCLMAASYLEFSLTGGTSHIVSDYGARRLLVAPAQLTSYYWDYFSSHLASYEGGGILGVLNPGGGGIGPARTIGAAYFGSSDANAGANIWASEYAYFGYMGILGASALAGIIMGIFDSSSRHGSVLLAGLVAGLIGIAWAESNLTTSLLSAGVLPLLLLNYVTPDLSRQRRGTIMNQRPKGQLIDHA